MLANDTKAAGIIERAGKAALGEEEFTDAMADAAVRASAGGRAAEQHQ